MSAHGGWERVIERLRARGIRFAPGLSDDEIARAEAAFAFRFPPDLRTFLQSALPIGDGFPDWRTVDAPELRRQLALPLDGILFDIEHNAFWLPEWGPAPQTPQEAKRVAAELVARGPKLIPVYQHRMMPDDPPREGNPVFSVHQTDIIVYGTDLWDYWCEEFGIEAVKPAAAEARRIRFWDAERFQEVRWRQEPGRNS